MVFSNPEVVRRVNGEFIPVALKAGMVNNPPRGVEGALYAEIARSKPAPQGICTTNSAGKVLAWALSFDDNKSILGFLDHVSDRYREFSDASSPVNAERYRKFPSHKLSDVNDNGKRINAPERHANGDRCPAVPALERGTLVGRIIGRALDDDGIPVSDTVRQELYMEARMQVAVSVQEQFARVATHTDGRRFRLPREFVQALVSPAFLGQLDVNPSGGVPGSQNERRVSDFWGQQVDFSDRDDTVRFRIDGKSNVAGVADYSRTRRSDGRLWEHTVALDWYGFIDIKNHRVNKLVMIANGKERLRWGTARLLLSTESAAEHLMAGHPIDLKCAVRYGLFAQPCSPDEVVDGAGNDRSRNGPGAAIQVKMQRLQAGLQQLRKSGGNPTRIVQRMKEFGPLMRAKQFKKAEALLDAALQLLAEHD